MLFLLPGLLFSRRMHQPLAEALAERGNRVLCLDLLGHGDSDRPPGMGNYSMTTFGRQTIALLDHAGLEQRCSAGPRGPDLARPWRASWAAARSSCRAAPICSPARSVGRLGQRTLVIGHFRDQIHPFSDADMLVRELPNARLVEASSIFELRLTPERLTSEIVAFVDECFRAAPRASVRSRACGGTRRPAAGRRPSP